MVDNGVTLVAAFASDSDGMLTPADEFQFVAVVRAPDVSRVTMRLSGAPFLSASKSFDLVPGDNWLQVADLKVDTELEPVIREQVIRQVGGSIAIRDGALALALDFSDLDGNSRTASFQPTVYDFNHTDTVVKIEYPDLKRLTGLPENGAGVDNYYLRGDLDFNHPDDFYVRKLAIEAGRRGGVFPDDPEKVADNIYAYINATFGDAEPGDFNSDYNIARLIDDGTIVRGRLNGGYICIGQSYLMASLTRTLGMPSRELNLAVAKPSYQRADGVWVVTWFQEGAVHTWYNGQWTLYDLWIGFKGSNGYFTGDLAYQMWATYDRRATEFVTLNGVPTTLKGHNFNLFPGNPPQFEFVEERTKPGYRVVGMPDGDGGAVTRGAGADAYLSAPNGPALETASPPAEGILSPPETRP